MSSSESIPQIVANKTSGNINILGRQVSKRLVLLVVGLLVVAALYWMWRRRDAAAKRHRVAVAEEMDEPDTAGVYNM